MDLYVDVRKAKVKLSLQKVKIQSEIILGEEFRLKTLWESAGNGASWEEYNYIEKLIVNNGNIFYKYNHLIDIYEIYKCGGQNSTAGKFYEPFLENVELSYMEPRFLTLGETVIKTEQQYTDFKIVQHFTNKIYFIASNDLAKGTSLYAADNIGKAAKEVVAQKVGTWNDLLTAIAIDQLTGDIILALHKTFQGRSEKAYIQMFQKLPYLSEMLTIVGLTNSKENVEQEAQ